MSYKNVLTTLVLTGAVLSGGSGLAAQGVVKQEINKNWTFKQVRGNNWYQASVPGVVHTDLIDNKIIEDPYFRLNERGVQWVDKEDWEYKAPLVVSSDIFSKDNIELDFKGLDTYADVYLNDSLILKANNMFREWTVNVKPLLKKDGNELRIYFHSPLKIDIPKWDALDYQNEAGNDQSENGGVFNKKVSVFARKAGYHYGWDWGPRLVTSGIWRPVYLMGWNDARIESVQYIQQSVTAKAAQIKARVEVIADKSGEATVTISAEGVGRGWTKKANVKKGVNIIETDLTVTNPKLWWSNGLGEAHLYPFKAEVAMNGKVADMQKDNLGLRSLKVVYEKDAEGHTFHFELNGHKVFMKGANYIPQDNFLPRVTAEKYEKTILDAVNANMNMLRVWEGGTYENDIFYDLCDKYGILVWQDFMFACSTYPGEGELLDNIREEAIDNVKRLRNHPSIAIWCGNNENQTAWFGWGWVKQYTKLGVADKIWKQFKNIYFDVLPKVVETYDPTTFYWPSSPYAGNPEGNADEANGDAHYWGVWHGKDSIANYNVKRARFFSEYGFQSFPEFESVKKYAPEKRDWDIFSEVMMAHQRGGSHANSLIQWYLLNEYSKPKDFPNFLYMGQLLQGDAIKTAIEAHRRDMPYCMGTLFWQHNDCWPVASWSSRDFYGRWKAQHYSSKKAFKDILVSPIIKGNSLDVYVVSDRLKVTKGKLDIRVMDLKGNVVFEMDKQITLPANTSKVQYAGALDKILKGRAKNEVVVNAKFIESKGETYYNNYYLTRFKEIDFPKANIKLSSTSAKDGYDVTVQSDVVARGVFLSIEGIENFFSDNYFDVLPGEPVTIHVTTSLDKATFDKQLKSESISDAY